VAEADVVAGVERAAVGRFFDEEEVALILGGCKDDRVRDVYLVLLYTGLRIGELVNLEWADVDFIRRAIAIRPKDFWKPILEVLVERGGRASGGRCGR
jgi:integrase